MEFHACLRRWGHIYTDMHDMALNIIINIICVVYRTISDLYQILQLQILF